jgi:hypothetical protein
MIRGPNMSTGGAEAELTNPNANLRHFDAIMKELLANQNKLLLGMESLAQNYKALAREIQTFKEKPADEGGRNVISQTTSTPETPKSFLAHPDPLMIDTFHSMNAPHYYT